MSTYWPAGATPIVTDQPRLHALVIGVSRYPHLIGGGGDPAQDPLMLGQVTTPADTAREIAGWRTTGYGNPARPLGSVELLLSDDQPAVAGAGPATMASIGQAVKRWRDRCSTQPDNIALFYFCGHGLAKDEQYLLPEDFGDPALAGPWQNCIDFEGLRLGLRSECAARTQVFFVDACRETPFNVLTQVNVHGESLAGGRRFASGVRTQATYYATGEEKQRRFMRLAGCMDGATDLSSRKGFSKG